MDHILMHRYTIPAKNVKKKIIYHFSDCHLTEYDDLSPQDEVQRAIERTELWEYRRKANAEAFGEPCGESQRIPSYRHFENLIGCTQDADAVVIAGDLIDYVTGGNLRAAEKGLKELSCPYIEVSGNHEKMGEIPDDAMLAPINQGIQTVDLGDLLLIGVDDGKREITKKQNDTLRTLLKKGKPAIIVMHIPLVTEENRARFEELDDYFKLNYEGCPEENLAFVDIIKEYAETVVAVFAGHLHHLDVSPITDGVTQYVSTQGIVGNINRYVIGE